MCTRASYVGPLRRPPRHIRCFPPAPAAHLPSARSPEPPSSSPSPRRRDGTTLPDGPFECEATRQGRQHGALSNVSNALAACLSTAPARPVVHQPLIEQQVTLCRLAAGAARRSAAAACIEWCLQTTRPAAPEGRGSSGAGRTPKERLPDRSGRGRERREHESALRRLVSLPRRDTVMLGQ